MLGAVKTKRRLHFERAFLLFPYGQYLAWNIAYRFICTVNITISLNLLYIFRNVVKTIIRTFVFVQKETAFQPNEIAFCYLCFRDWAKYCSRTLQVKKSRCFCLVNVIKVLSTFKPSQKCEQQTFSNNTHSIEFPYKKAVSTFFIPTLKPSNQILMNLEVPDTFPLSKTTV